MQTSIRLLLVEDEEGIVFLLEETLRDAGFELEVAKSGSEALTILEAETKTLCGVITDINLGEGPDGWQVARHARELSSQIPVVYMSGGSGHEWTSHGVPNSTMVSKPFAPAQIITAISAQLNTTDAR
jgi:DNA-binding response OmpR family regulator